MNARRIITIVLLIFVAASVIYLIANEVKSPSRDKAFATDAPRDNTAASDSAVALKDKTVTVYYFHTTFRCPTCRKIEAMTESTVKNFFTRELAAQQILWKTVNIELPENRHFADDYKLFTKSVVIVDTVKGKQVRWKNLERIWELVRDEGAFTSYIQNEIRGYLKAL
jgi:hypothetical protein